MTRTGFSNENYDPSPDLKVWMNGELKAGPDATVNVFDHGLLYGDGIFEGIRCYSGKVFERIAHLRRFQDSARAIRLDLPYDTRGLSDAVDAALEANGLLKPDKDSYVRMVATRGVGVLGISPFRTWKPSVIVIASTIQMYPKEMYENGMPVIIGSVTRNHPNAMPPRIKSLNYLNNILCKIEAHDAGVGEAVMMNHMGYVAEATGDNIFFVRDGQLRTPHVASGILEGITRKTVIRLAREMGIEVEEKIVERFDLYTADEMFLTGTGAEVIPVTSIDKRAVGDGTVGPITKKLIETYRRYTREAEDVRP
ncbi:MAG: branched-chain-amino-acid transaminase [Phycisphaerae bacterium]